MAYSFGTTQPTLDSKTKGGVQYPYPIGPSTIGQNIPAQGQVQYDSPAGPPGPVGTDAQLYGAYDQSNPVHAMLAKLLQQQLAQGPEMQKQATAGRLATIAALRHDPVHDANLTSSMPSYMPGSTSPFNTGFFKDASQRAAAETSAFGTPGASSATPEQRAAVVGATQAQHPNGLPVVPPSVPGSNPAMADGTMPNTPLQGGHNIPAGGVQGMINPALPDAQKYLDPNFYSIQPGVTTLPPGAVAGDGTSMYRRKPPAPMPPPVASAPSYVGSTVGY